MAIIIDEDKKKSFPFAFVGWLAILAIICVAAYYIFFVQPQLVILPTPANLDSIAPFANAAINPSDIVSSSAFTSLRSTIVPPSPKGPASIGKSNPFLP